MDTEPDRLSPEIPPPPPQLQVKSLWISLLLPSGALTLFMVVLNIMPGLMNGPGSETTLTLLCVVACIATIIGWILYIVCLSKRFRGSSLVLLILAYPILQAVLLFSIFFVGCLALVWQDGLI